MALGLPVIVSDFALWRTIVDDAKCGFAVDPLDAKAVMEALQWTLTHPIEAREMGLRGQEAVINKYSWASEYKKLHDLYHKILAL